MRAGKASFRSPGGTEPRDGSVEPSPRSHRPWCGAGTGAPHCILPRLSPGTRGRFLSVCFFPSPLYSLAQAAAHRSHRVAWLRQGSRGPIRSWVSLSSLALPVPSGGPRKWWLFKFPVTTPPPHTQFQFLLKPPAAQNPWLLLAHVAGTS